MNLLLFLKAPVPGRVKTRLARDMGTEAAAAAYIDMVREIRDAVELQHDLSLQWVYEPAGDFPDLGWLDIPAAKFWKQTGGDLGARLEAAFQKAFSEFTGPVCAIGMDSPGLPPEHIAEAFRALKSHDIVLGPTEDGGYYLIGTARHRPELFEDIPWSGPDVAARTLARAKEKSLSLHVLPKFYDVDTIVEYERWKAGSTKAG